MPLSTEALPNKALSGTELVEVVLADIRAVLERDGLFSPYVAYNRVAYDVSVEFHFDNPLVGKHLVRSRGVKPPLDEPSDEAESFGATRHRVIESANLARVELGMGIPVQRVDQATGRIVDQTIRYEAEQREQVLEGAAEQGIENPVIDQDTTPVVRRKHRKGV